MDDTATALMIDALDMLVRSESPETEPCSYCGDEAGHPTCRRCPVVLARQALDLARVPNASVGRG